MEKYQSVISKIIFIMKERDRKRKEEYSRNVIEEEIRDY